MARMNMVQALNSAMDVMLGRDPRVVIGVVAFQAVSLAWLGLAARAVAKSQTAAAAA